MTQIVARHQELQALNKIYSSGKSEFLAVYGRRRVGKTFLIREFFRDKGTYFHITGVKDSPVRKQLRNFIEEFKRVFKTSPPSLPKDWQEAFSFLREAIEALPGSQRIILFFDELPWLATHRSLFLQDLDYFWNRHASDNNRVVLIICGSAAAWMIRKIIQHKGGLHGRLTATIHLKPFDLSETELFLKSQDVILDRRQIIELYMAIGGIPKYLTYVERGLSSVQIINKICFKGPLVDEFDELYSSLFEHHDRYVAIVRALTKRNQGLTKTEITEATGMTSGGGLNIILEDLEQSGFIMLIPDLGKTKKNLRYRLVDEYSLFYIRWIEKAKELNIGGIDANFWINTEGSPELRAWAGYTFEGICMKHLGAIKETLGISGVLTHTSGWLYKPEKESAEKGTQIDLIIDRADNCINLCEIKFSNDTFTINKAYEQVLRQRKSIFIEKTGTRKTVFLTFITLYGISKESGYFGIVDKELTMDDLFQPARIGSH
ncbi:MAG: ATP-binding protein [Chlamydiota bacterium]